MGLWHYLTRWGAERGWQRWLSWAKRCRMGPMVKVARTVEKHLWGIVNAVVLRVDNASAESINSRIKMIKTRARGFRARPLAFSPTRPDQNARAGVPQQGAFPHRDLLLSGRPRPLPRRRQILADPHRLMKSHISLVLIIAVLQAIVGSVLSISDDERNVVGVSREYASNGRVLAQAAGSSTISHTLGGGLVHAVYSLGGTIPTTFQVGRVIAFVLAVSGALTIALAMIRHVSPGYAFWFLAIYGLSPWTIYHGARVWEPGLMLFVVAVVFAAAICVRDTARFWSSAVIGWSVLAAYQAYASFAIPVLSLALLLWRRKLRLAIAGALLGGVLGSITLWPALFPRSLDPIANAVTTVRHRDPRLGYGLMTVYPIARAAGFWLRFPSADLNRQVRESRLFAHQGTKPESEVVLRRAALVALLSLAFASVVLSLWANVWFFRQSYGATNEAMAWLRKYAGATLASLLIASAISPLCIQGYHAAAALPAACVPMAGWCEHAWNSGSRFWRGIVLTLLVVCGLVTMVVAVGYKG